jgi:hypothetical protein
MAVGRDPHPTGDSGDEFGKIASEIRGLGDVVRARLEEERDWTTRALGIVLLVVTFLQAIPLWITSPPTGSFRVLAAGLFLFTLAVAALLLVAPRRVRDAFARWLRLRPPPLPAGVGAVTEAIRQIHVNEAEIQEVSTLAVTTSFVLVILVSIGSVVGALVLSVSVAARFGGLAFPVFALAGLAAAAGVITLATLAVVRWRLHSLRELDRQNARRWNELSRLQQDFWERY